MSAQDKDGQMRWWGVFDVPDRHTVHWRIGPMRLFAWRGSGEWRVSFCSGEDALDPACEVVTRNVTAPDDAGLTEHRYAFDSLDMRLRLVPATADRAVVVEPATPLFVPPGQKTRLYVSSVAWLVLSAFDHDGEEVRLFEAPAHRPTDTWFGVSTRYGELCYATRTLARTSSDLLMNVPHRIFTAVEIENNGVDLLPVQQLRVPAPNLSVYAGKGNRLWTDTVVFDRKEGDTDATLRIANKSFDGHDAADRERLSAPREPLHSRAVVRAFSKIFG